MNLLRLNWKQEFNLGSQAICHSLLRGPNVLAGSCFLNHAVPQSAGVLYFLSPSWIKLSARDYAEGA